jgi:XTP/dITP diphosphohydrolase
MLMSRINGMPEINRVVLATNNRHKAVEISRILTTVEVLLPADVGVSFEYEETGQNFLDNAYGKALALYHHLERPVLADDSGLAVSALDGAPGIFSARYGSDVFGRPLTDAQRNSYLLQQMEDKPERSCFFVCCMVLMVEEYRYFTAQETVEGVVAREAVGSGGFGYDPLFFLPDLGKTVAQLSSGEKDQLSHRGRAARRIQCLLNSLSLDS